MGVFVRFPLLLIGVVIFVEALDQYQNYNEGSCSSIRWNAASLIANASFNEWVTTLPFIPVGSKNFYFNAASIHPDYGKLTEQDIRNNLCLHRDDRIVDGAGTSIYTGFDKIKILAEYNVEVVTDQTGRRFWDHTPKAPLPSWDKLRQSVTLTDGQSWAFLTGCWKGSDQKTFAVVSASLELTTATRNQVTQHALALGFKRKNFFEMNYDRCWLDNSILSEVVASAEKNNSSVGEINKTGPTTTLRSNNTRPFRRHKIRQTTTIEPTVKRSATRSGNSETDYKRR